MSPPLIYSVIVLTLSWAYAAFVFSRPERMNFFPWVMMIPGLTALAMKIATERSAKTLLQPFVGIRIRGPYIFAVCYPLLIIAACAVTSSFLGLATPNWSKVHTLVPRFGIVGLSVSILLILGEEYGWRGYLLPELIRRHSPFVAATIVGIIWALWHAPLLYGLSSRQGTGSPFLVCAVQMAAVLCVSYPFAHAYIGSRSIVPGMIIHWLWNEYNPTVLGNLYRNRPGIMEGSMLLINGEGVMGVALGLLFVLWFGRYARVRSDGDTVVTQ